MAGFLIDTDVLIDISRGSVDAADYVDALPEEIFIGNLLDLYLTVLRQAVRCCGVAATVDRTNRVSPDMMTIASSSI